MKRIALDISQLQYGYSGITNYIRGLIEILQEACPETILIKNYKKKVSYPNTKTFRFSFRNFKLRRLWDRFIIGKLAKMLRAGILISPYFYTPPQKGFTKIPVIYDLEFIKRNDKDMNSINYFTVSTENSIKRADHILTISNTIKREITEYYNFPKERIIVLYPKISIPESMPEPPGEKDIFLCLGTIEERKNPELVIDIFQEILQQRPSAELIFAGAVRKEYQQTFDAKLSSLSPSVRAAIRLKGYVSDEEKETLLDHSLYIFYLSSYEGFGIPIIEAFSSGCIPIILGTEISREVACGGGILIDDIRTEPKILFQDTYITEHLKNADNALKRYATEYNRQKSEFIKFLNMSARLTF